MRKSLLLLAFGAMALGSSADAVAADNAWSEAYVVVGNFVTDNYMAGAVSHEMTKTGDAFEATVTFTDAVHKFVITDMLCTTDDELIRHNYGMYTGTSIVVGGKNELDQGYSSDIDRYSVFDSNIPVGTYKFTLTFSEYNGKLFPDLYIEKTADPVTPPAEEKSLYLIGSLVDHNWDTAGSPKMTQNGKVYTLENVEIANVDNSGVGYFSFATTLGANWDEVNASTRYGASYNNELVTAGQAATLYNYEGGAAAGSTNAFMVAAGTYDFVADLDAMTVTLTAKGGTTPEPVEPETLYLIGNLVDHQWDTANSPEMSKNGNVYTLDNVEITDADNSGVGYFSFITVLGADWNEVNAGTRYGASSGNEPIVSGEVAPLLRFAGANAGSANSYMVAASTYDFMVDLDNMTVMVTDKSNNPEPKPDGIETISANSAAAQYFNMQGIRVNNPVAGRIYLVRRGNEVSKILMK